MSEDFYDNLARPGSKVDVDVDTIPDSDTREDDLAAIIDYKTFKVAPTPQIIDSNKEEK